MKQRINNIWLLIDSRYPGGIESHVHQLAEGLHKKNKDVYVVFINNYGKHPLRDALNKTGIKTMSLDGRFISIWKEARKSKPSIIHTHGYKAGIFGRIIGKFCNIPVASTYHMGESPSGRLTLYDWVDRHTARLAAIVFAVSPQIAKRLPVKAKIVDNFVDTTSLETSKGNQIAFVGRLSIEKGPDYFLHLASLFPKEIFHIYGGGPLENELKLLAPQNIYFHGQQDDMSLVWPNIGLLVMPSRYEGLPMAALESMAHGIPVLASNVGALDQLIDPGINGWLFSAGSHDELEMYFRLWINMNEMSKQQLKIAAEQKILQRFSADIAIPLLFANYIQITR